MTHLPFEYFALILNEFEKPKLVVEDGFRSFGGVNERWHPTWPGWRFIDQDEIDHAYSLLYSFYSNRWHQVKGHMLQEPLDLLYFDFAINTGGRVACRELQKTINSLGQPDIALDVDGLMGPKTSGAARVLGGVRLNSYYLLSRMAFYNSLSENSQTHRKYLRGWIKRVCKLGEWL